MKRALWPAAAVLPGLVLAFALLERVPVTSGPQWSAEARRNPLLAGGLLLRQEGYRVDFLPRPGGPPPGNGVFYLHADSGVLPPQTLDDWRRWLRRGNRLIVTAQDTGDPARGMRDPLLGPLDVVLHTRRAPGQAGDSAPGPDRLRVDGGRYWLAAEFHPGRILEDRGGRATDAWRDAGGLHALTYRAGRGSVIVLSDHAPFGNAALARHDHAALWLRLFRDSGTSRQVWLAHGGEVPGILTLISRQAPAALTGLAVLVAALVWMGNSPFGPRLPSPQPPRRRLTEHLQAAGRYHARHGARERLYGAVRRGLLRQLYRHHPHWRTLDPAALAGELHRLTGLDIGGIRQALESPPDHDNLRFLRDMRTLHQLRKLT